MKMTIATALAALAFLAAAGVVAAAPLPPQQSGGPARPADPFPVVETLDPARYAGTWHEIARMPFKYQQKCVADETATYERRDEGNVTVINRCRMADGRMSEAKGVAKRASKDGPAGKLKVRFAPSWLSFIGAVWGNYWIRVLPPDYSYVAIGEPDRKLLWVLSRTPSMDEATLQSVLDRARANGYDLTGLIRHQ